MGEKEKIKAKAEELAGKVHAKIGEMKGDPEMVARGEAKREEGAENAEVEREVGYAKGVGDSVAGRIKDKIGHNTAQPHLADKGVAQAVRGDVERELNKK